MGLKTKLINRLEAVYAKVPKIECKQLCHAYCGPIAMSRLEWVRWKAAHGGEPQPRSDLTCPALECGICTVYEARPMICRLWGTTPELACPHGCVPERWLSDKEAHQLLDEMEKSGR